MRAKNPAFLFFLAVPLLLLAACGRRAEATPTPGLNATQSFQTAIAQVTAYYEETVNAGSASETPSETTVPATPTETPGAGTPSATPAPPTAKPTATPQPCDKAAPGNPIDVTIPDDTDIAPGVSFTKTWRLINSGTCTWTNQYAVVWVSGAQIGNQDAFFLSGSVGSGQSVDISVPMTAPDDTGSYQSNWQLRNAQGVLFGIGDDGKGVFWVRIDVVAPTATPTPTITATSPASPTPSPSPTPVVFADGSSELAIGDSYDLDSLVVNGAGADLSYALDGSSNHVLSPLGGARIGVFGGTAPGFAQCQAASLASAPLAVESVGVGTYLCFQTDGGRYGRLQITGFDNNTGALTIGVTTWAVP